MNKSLCGALLLVLVALATSLTAQQGDKEKEKQAEIAANLPAAIWRDPGPVSVLNLFFGAGSNMHAPNPKGTYTFLAEDTAATSPKFDIADERGIQWKVKLGEEAQSETAATRLMWAAGYFVDEDYFLGELTVKGLKLHRGDAFVSRGGVVHGARLERKLDDVEKLATWDWFDNPFMDTRELNGLRVMMALLNNWDLKEVNNSIYKVGGDLRYLVTDLGASFGSTGNRVVRSKNTPKDYADSKFVEKATPEFIDFVLDSRPFILSAALNPPKYQTRARMEDIARKIPRADAKWLGERLSMLSEEQIRDCFRAAGYSPYQIELYTRALQKRIAALNAS